MKKLLLITSSTFFLFGCPAPQRTDSIEMDSANIISPVVQDDDYVTIKKICDEGNFVYWASKNGHSPSIFVLHNSCQGTN